MGSLVAKNRRSIPVAIFPICLVRSHEIQQMFHLHIGLSRRHWWTTQYIHFALHLWLPRTPTPPLAAEHSGIHYQHNVLWCVPPVRHAVGNMVNKRGNRWHDCRADDRLVYSPYKGDVHLYRWKFFSSLYQKCKSWSNYILMHDSEFRICDRLSVAGYMFDHSLTGRCSSDNSVFEHFHIIALLWLLVYLYVFSFFSFCCTSCE